jgi:hypothetical protein
MCGVAIMRLMPKLCKSEISAIDFSTFGEPSSTPGMMWQCISVENQNFIGSFDLLKKLNIVVLIILECKNTIFFG